MSMPNLVATTNSSRWPCSASPSRLSLPPGGSPYTSAVSRSVTPTSRAADRMSRTPSRSTRRPKALQPTPTALTIRPESPSGRYVISLMTSTLASRGSLDQVEVADAEAVVLELLVEDGAEALAHRPATGVGRPARAVGDGGWARQLLGSDVGEPRLTLGRLLGAD